MPTNLALKISVANLEDSVCRAVACIEFLHEKLNSLIAVNPDADSPACLAESGYAMLACKAVTDLVGAFNHARREFIREAEAAPAPGPHRPGGGISDYTEMEYAALIQGLGRVMEEQFAAPAADIAAMAKARGASPAMADEMALAILLDQGHGFPLRNSAGFAALRYAMEEAEAAHRALPPLPEIGHPTSES